jgi:hypothetical protein
MRITVQITYNPDVSPLGFVRCAAQDGRGGKPRVHNATVQVQDGLEELEESVCMFLARVLPRIEHQGVIQLWPEG